MEEISKKLYQILEESCNSCESELIALSGGLDSSILAHFLKKRNIEGVAIISEDFVSTDLTYCQRISKETEIPLTIHSTTTSEILEAIEKINIYCHNFEDEEEFYSSDDQLYFNAVVNLLIAIGEENKKIDTQIKNDYPFSWKEISKMRDKISHNYRGVSPYVVWDIVQNSLPQYKQTILEILPITALVPTFTTINIKVNL